MHSFGARRVVVVVGAAVALSACAAVTADDEPQTRPARAGGDTTIDDESRDAFSYSARNLPPAGRDLFHVGKALFQRPWVRAPSSTEGGDGLGPTYTGTSCAACHVRGGRGDVPEHPGDRAIGLVVRLTSVKDREGRGWSEPAYGGILQPFAIEGVSPEADFDVTYEATRYEFADGEQAVLRKPTVSVRGLAFGPLRTDTILDVRLAPQLVGLGLLEAIPEAEVRGRADPYDSDQNGIRGEASEVPTLAGSAKELGRFGWRASFATVSDFVGTAFFEDIGLTSPDHPSPNCPSVQIACADALNGGTPELSAEQLDRVAFFVRTLAVPARRRTGDPEVLRGEAVFARVGCADCHVPSTVTGDASIPALANQSIAPYTDLLLHWMGEGLADPLRQSTRTPPLWGLGLHGVVNGHRFLLHDGRARTATEAILWHSGEAEKSKARFGALSATERTALDRFLESL